MLIAEARNLQWIARRLRRESGLAWLRTFPAEHLSTLLVAPMAVARWIWRERPDLLERERLSLAVAANGLDLFAGGAMWHLLSVALGKPASWARVKLVASARIETPGAELAREFHERGIISIVRSEQLTLLPAEVQRTWDIAFLPASFACGLVNSLASSDGTLWPLLESGGTILQGVRHRWETWISDGAAAAGGCSLAVAENPLRGPLIDGGHDECAYLVSVRGGARPADWQRFVRELCMLEEIAECADAFAKQWARGEEPEDFRLWGMKALTKASLDESDVYAALPLRFAARVADGKIYLIEGDVPTHEMRPRIDPRTRDPESVPSETWIGRVWWACQVWVKALEADYLNTVGGSLEGKLGVTFEKQRDSLRDAFAKAGLDAATAKYMTEATLGGPPYSPSHEERLLFQALADGGAEAAIRLVRANSTLANARDVRCRPLLLAMAELGSKDGMSELVALGGDINARDGGHRPIVVQMARNCGPEVVERALELGANIDDQDPLGWTPLQAALVNGKWDTAGMLVDRGADPRLGEELGRSPTEMVSGRYAERIAKLSDYSRAMASSLGFDLVEDVLEVMKRRGTMNDPSTAPQWLKDKILAVA